MRVVTVLILVLLVVGIGWVALIGFGSGIDPRVKQVGTLNRERIPESSGIVASRRHEGVYWTHSDQGNAAAIFAINRQGDTLSDFRIDAPNDDWEDIATDDEGRLYIGSIGNNDAREKEIAVYRVEEPDPRASKKERKDKLRPEREWRLRFPGERFDCESLFIHGKHGYVISKVFGGREARIYRFELEGEEKQTLDEVTALPIRSPVTSASLSRDGARLALLSWEGIWVFPVNGDIKSTGAVKPVFVRLESEKAEGCTFTEDGILVTLETGEIYFCPNEAMSQ